MITRPDAPPMNRLRSPFATTSRPRVAHRTWLPALMLVAAGLPTLAQAECARPIRVPVADIGAAVTVKDGEVGGIFPELLRAEARRDGCEIVFSAVPRARQEMLFETGQADVLVPARRSAQRDRHGRFVPMMQSRAALVWIGPDRPRFLALSELADHGTLRVGIVRGYDYDEPYQSAVRALERQGRLVRATDPVSLARMLNEGVADIAVITPTAVTGALRRDPRWRHLAERVHYEIDEALPWGDSGAYVSHSTALGARDRARIASWLERMARTGTAWREFQRQYPEDRLTDTVRPKP
jgi:polar amino acid transport system substrate-binding protein